MEQVKRGHYSDWLLNPKQHCAQDPARVPAQGAHCSLLSGAGRAVCVGEEINSAKAGQGLGRGRVFPAQLL